MVPAPPLAAPLAACRRTGKWVRAGVIRQPLPAPPQHARATKTQACGAHAAACCAACRLQGSFKKVAQLSPYIFHFVNSGTGPRGRAGRGQVGPLLQQCPQEHSTSGLAGTAPSRHSTSAPKLGPNKGDPLTVAQGVHDTGAGRAGPRVAQQQAPVAALAPPLPARCLAAGSSAARSRGSGGGCEGPAAQLAARVGCDPWVPARDNGVRSCAIIALD